MTLSRLLSILLLWLIYSIGSTALILLAMPISAALSSAVFWWPVRFRDMWELVIVGPVAGALLTLVVVMTDRNG